MLGKENSTPKVTEIVPRFCQPGELTEEQRSDPDYRLKLLELMNKGRLKITCSKCHHCR